MVMKLLCTLGSVKLYHTLCRKCLPSFCPIVLYNTSVRPLVEYTNRRFNFQALKMLKNKIKITYNKLLAIAGHIISKIFYPPFDYLYIIPIATR